MLPVRCVVICQRWQLETVLLTCEFTLRITKFILISMELLECILRDLLRESTTLAIALGCAPLWAMYSYILLRLIPLPRYLYMISFLVNNLLLVPISLFRQSSFILKRTTAVGLLERTRFCTRYFTIGI